MTTALATSASEAVDVAVSGVELSDVAAASKPSDVVHSEDGKARISKKRILSDTDSLEDNYWPGRHPPWKVLRLMDGTMEVRKWRNVPCEGGDRCWRNHGGYCFFLHEESSGTVVESGNWTHCNSFVRLAALSRKNILRNNVSEEESLLASVDEKQDEMIDGADTHSLMPAGFISNADVATPLADESDSHDKKLQKKIMRWKLFHSKLDRFRRVSDNAKQAA